MTHAIAPANLRRLAAPSCLLGEGPNYDRHTDTAWWFDILGRKLIEQRAGESAATVHDLPFSASALARIDSRRQLIFAETGLYIRDRTTGSLEPHLAIEAGNAANRCNDARVHPTGAFWLGTMGREAEDRAGAIYHYRAGVLTTLFEGITITNSICFSPDGSVGYYSDTELKQVMRVRLDPQTGLPLGAPTLFLGDFAEDAGPDGAVTDAEGNLWIALWGVGTVQGYSPQGDKLGRFSLPASQVSCPVFIGEDASSMLVTSARTGLEQADAEDESGATFTFDLPFKGRFEPDVEL